MTNESMSYTTSEIDVGDRQVFPQVLYDALVIEMNDLTEQNTEAVISWLEGIRFTGLYMFFSPVQIENISRTIAQSPDIRKFLLSLTDRVLVLMEVNGLSELYREVSEKILVIQGMRHLPLSLVAKDVAAGISLEEEELNALIDANTWLVALYLCFATGQYALAFRSYVDALPPIQPV